MFLTFVKKGTYALRSHDYTPTTRFPSKSVTGLAYTYYIRPLLEYMCSVWGPKVHNIDYLSDNLEAFQKRVTKIILGPKYDTYATATLKILTLRKRRFHLTCKFGKSLLASEKHRTLLHPLIAPKANTRHRNKFEPTRCRTIRFSNPFIPFYTSVIIHT